MKFKKSLTAVVSVLLCLGILLGIVLPLLPGIFPAAQADEMHTVRIEAEDAYWNGYQVVKTATVSPYSTVIGNAASTHTYPTWSEVSGLALNKNIHIYVAFCVDVPQAGIYQISTANVIRMRQNSTPYGAIVVNPQFNGQAYKLDYTAVDTNVTHLVSSTADVQLQKGRNMIYMIPFTADQSINWADADYIEITGGHAVTHIAPTEAIHVAANAGGSHKFSTVSADALSGADVTQAKGLTAAALTRADLSKVPHVTYMVEAPADGYYDIALKYSCSSISGFAFALLVDNRAAEVKSIPAAGENLADISTYLTKGVHALTIPIALPATDSAKAVSASGLRGLILNDGLTLSDQYHSLAMGTLLEAETYAFAWRYPNIYENNGRLLVGSSQPGLTKQTYAQLTSGEKPDKNQPMFTYQVEVFADGEYTLNVSYRDYAASDYYMIVIVDDKAYYKASYTGDDPNFTGRRLASATLKLTEGCHIIRLITLPGDSNASWIDVDYMAIRGTCPVAGIRQWTHLQAGNAEYQGFSGTTDAHSSYGQWWNNALTGYQGNSMADAAGITTQDFTETDLNNLGWFRYAIHVPRDGYYDLQTYLHPAASSSGTGKVLLGIEKRNANLINQAQGVLALRYTGDSSGWLDLAGEYSSFSVTVKNNLPMAQSAEAPGQAGYAMVLRVSMDNGKFYAFRIYNDASVRYGYSRYGANGSSSGWGGAVWLDDTTTALLGSAGAVFQVERTGGNTLTLTLNGKVIDTYTMEGVTANNKMVSVGFRQYGNPTEEDEVVEIAFDATPADGRVSMDLPGLENGSVVTEKESYKVGDTVVLNVTPLPGFSQKLTLNGEPILLDWNTGKFSFTATDKTYDVGGGFEKIYWNNTLYTWVDVRLDAGAERWWLADLSSYLTEGDYIITVSGLMDYSGASYDQCDMGALTVSGGITAIGMPVQPGEAENMVAHWSLLSDPLAVQFTFKDLQAGDTITFHIGNQQLESIQVAAGKYIVYITEAQKTQPITVRCNGKVLSRTYVPNTASLESVKSENLTGVTTQLSSGGELFYLNENLTNLPDPFVLDNTARDGYYYLYGTWGAFRCFRSKNLMDWQDCGEVLQQYRENNKIWDSTNSKYSYQVLGTDLWAPEVVYDADTKLYYMFFSASPDVKGQAVDGPAQEMLMVATSTSPTGPFNLVNFKSASSCGAENVHTYSTSTYSDYFAPYLLLDPAQNKAFSTKINNGEWRGSNNGGYAAGIDAHPYVAPDGTKYLFWVDSKGADRICGVEMENWLKPKWETATVLTYYSYYTVTDYQNGSSNKVSYETATTTNEGPFITEHNGKYYLTYSANNWKNNTYLVAQAVSDNVLGPYTKLKESEGGILLSGKTQGSQTSNGTGHHSMVSVGDQLFIIYHRHTNPAEGGAQRNHAIDEVKWINVSGREVMYVNGPNTTLQPKVEAYSNYENIALEATVTGNGTNLKYLNDGLLSHLKNGHSNVTGVVGETTLTKTATFAFTFDQIRTVTSVMVYNSRQEAQTFRQVKQIKLVCVEDGKLVTKYINNVAFNSEYFQTDSSGNITYVEPCSAAYAVFTQQQVISVEITVEVPAGQSSVGISEIMILGN